MDRRRREIFTAIGAVCLCSFAERAIAAAAACYDPASIPLAQKNLKRSLGFVEASTDPKQKCGLCAFFTPTKGICGTCQMLSGAPVTTQGVCSSFAPRG
jgi:hypothetical protein